MSAQNQCAYESQSGNHNFVCSKAALTPSLRLVKQKIEKSIPRQNPSEKRMVEIEIPVIPSNRRNCVVERWGEPFLNVSQALEIVFAFWAHF